MKLFHAEMSEKWRYQRRQIGAQKMVVDVFQISPWISVYLEILTPSKNDFEIDL